MARLETVACSGNYAFMIYDLSATHSVSAMKLAAY